MIAVVEAERNAIVAGEADAPAHPHAGKAQALAKLKGIGPGFAMGLSGEVFYRNFATSQRGGKLCRAHVVGPPAGKNPLASGSLANIQARLLRTLSHAAIPPLPE